VPRKSLRLLALLSMTAFLIANTPGMGAHALGLLPDSGHQGAHAEEFVARLDAGIKPGSCHHCRHCAEHRHAHSGRQDLEIPDHHELTAEHCPLCSCDQDEDCCPCCPKHPSSPSCPCPGGCAFCSVAKVPCLVWTSLTMLPAPCMGESLREASVLYLPPAPTKLIRPPRV
jgi:hypothetical protein